ncbi:hypothetical protein CBM2587_B90227 [Cupriavidus taiwanensis]|uniref:Uncharacterized protein n=1 Tax=Cupriavidus taiwanensis TaxID=164546 RepID=A0A975XEF6_9BURK|nr:hypothetical protein CBM2587_B90227 [Cupriavidus taiwanensis]
MGRMKPGHPAALLAAVAHYWRHAMRVESSGPVRSPACKGFGRMLHYPCDTLVSAWLRATA